MACIIFMLLNTDRNNYCISTPPSFLHHHCLQFLYTTNFLGENVFYILFCLYDKIKLPYCLASQCLHLCSCSTCTSRQALCTVADARFCSGSALHVAKYRTIQFYVLSLQMTLIQIVTLLITAYTRRNTPPL